MTMLTIFLSKSFKELQSIQMALDYLLVGLLGRKRLLRRVKKSILYIKINQDKNNINIDIVLNMIIRVYIFISSTTKTLHRTRLGRTQSHSTSLTAWEPLPTTPSSFSRTSCGGSLSPVSTGILLAFHFFRCLCLCHFVFAYHLN